MNDRPTVTELPALCWCRAETEGDVRAGREPHRHDPHRHVGTFLSCPRRPTTEHDARVLDVMHAMAISDVLDDVPTKYVARVTMAVLDHLDNAGGTA